MAVQNRKVRRVITHIRPEDAATFTEAQIMGWGATEYALAQALLRDALQRLRDLPEEERRAEVGRLLEARKAAWAADERA